MISSPQRPADAVNRRRTHTFLIPENRERALRLVLAALTGALVFHLVLFVLLWYFDINMPIYRRTQISQAEEERVIVNVRPDDEMPPPPDPVPEPEDITHEDLDPPDILDLPLENLTISPEETSISVKSVTVNEPGGEETISHVDITKLSTDLPAPSVDPAFINANPVVIKAPDVQQLNPLNENDLGKGGPGNAVDPYGSDSLRNLLERPGGTLGQGDKATLQADLLFEYDKADLKKTAHIGLLLLAALIEKNPETRFIIEGHTDSFGNDAYNRKLSFLRAESVRKWLEGNGIPLNRVYIRACAADNPVVPTTGDRVQQASNRRVEIHMRKQTEQLPADAMPFTATLEDLAKITPVAQAPKPPTTPKKEPGAIPAEVVEDFPVGVEVVE